MPSSSWVLAPAFKGVYFVNLETDTSRQIFIQLILKEMLEESNGRFSKALMLMLYLKPHGENRYIPDFKQFVITRTWNNCWMEDILNSYEKDGAWLKLRV